MNLPGITWDTLDWPALDRLRESFLAAEPAAGCYWQSVSDVANYDFTYAQRIGWKWDAVLAELRHRGWRPPGGTLIDWGCGSGIAARCVLDGFGAGSFEALELFDRSSLAVQFAEGRARARFPTLPVSSATTSPSPDRRGQPGAGNLRPRTLLISHVLNELDAAGGQALRSEIDQATAVIWIEPGAYADSRALIAMREALREQFVVVAPCTHQGRCGLLEAGNERHWCHHFARPPAGIMADSDWVNFSRRAGIDLRSIPYSFLVLERRPPASKPNSTRALGPGEDWARVIGQVRIYKGFAKVQSCQVDGVRDLELQKRDCPAAFKAFVNDKADWVYRWTLEGRWIRQAQPWPGPNDPSALEG
jgi:hypothetical protein